MNKLIEQKTDIIRYHLFRFFCYQKRMGILTPVPVKKNAVIQLIFHILADGRFAHSHRTADYK